MVNLNEYEEKEVERGIGRENVGVEKGVELEVGW